MKPKTEEKVVPSGVTNFCGGEFPMQTCEDPFYPRWRTTNGKLLPLKPTLQKMKEIEGKKEIGGLPQFWLLSFPLQSLSLMPSLQMIKKPCNKYNNNLLPSTKICSIKEVYLYLIMKYKKNEITSHVKGNSPSYY